MEKPLTACLKWHIIDTIKGSSPYAIYYKHRAVFVIVFPENNDIAGKTSTVWCIAMCFYGSLSLARSLSGALIAAVGTQRSVSGRVACQHLEASLMIIKTR